MSEQGTDLDKEIPVNYDLEVAAGNIGDTESLNKYGLNSSVNTAAPEFLWSPGGSFVLPTTARIHDIASSGSGAANDAAAGTGARTVRIFGLDASYVLKEETVTMNGTTNVPTLSTYTMIYRIRVLTAGSGETNDGVIAATAQTDGTVTAQMESGIGGTQMAVYLVPASTTFFMNDFYFEIDKSTGGSASVEIQIIEFTNVDTATPSRVVRHDGKNHSSDNPSTLLPFKPPKKFESKSLIYLLVTTDTNNVECSGGFNGYLRT